MKKGFTLVELLVVVLIIGILSSVAVPRYTRSVRRAELIEGLTNGKTIYDAAIRHKSVNSEYPTFDQIDVGFIGAENIDGYVFDDVKFTYIIEPSDPAHLAVINKDQGKDGYFLQMLFPVVSATGVSAPIYCCPSTSWVCNNASKVLSPDGACTEIK